MRNLCVETIRRSTAILADALEPREHSYNFGVHLLLPLNITKMQVLIYITPTVTITITHSFYQYHHTLIGWTIEHKNVIKSRLSLVWAYSFINTWPLELSSPLNSEYNCLVPPTMQGFCTSSLKRPPWWFTKIISIRAVQRLIGTSLLWHLGSSWALTKASSVNNNSQFNIPTEVVPRFKIPFTSENIENDFFPYFSENRVGFGKSNHDPATRTI